MGIPNIMHTGNSGLTAAKVGIATTGHNISNANVEGYSRQRMISETAEPRGGQIGHNMIGTGTRVARVERINDEITSKNSCGARIATLPTSKKKISASRRSKIFLTKWAAMA